jgi:hypothetical protein
MGAQGEVLLWVALNHYYHLRGGWPEAAWWWALVFTPLAIVAAWAGFLIGYAEMLLAQGIAKGFNAVFTFVRCTLSRPGG